MTEAQALLRLQQIDIELIRNAHTLQKLPQATKLQTIKLAQKKVASELSKIVGQRKDAEIDIDDLYEKLDKYERLRADVQADAETGVLTHREARDVETQLTQLAKATEKCEYNLGPLNEKLEKLKAAEANAKKTAERLVEQEAQVRASFDEDSATMTKRIKELDAERGSVAGQITPDVLARYEAARKRFGGLAVESLVGNVPTTCRVKLQPSLYHDLAHGPEITECPYCHRILVTTAETGE